MSVVLPDAAAARNPRETGLRIARLHYPGGGDWYCDPSSLPNWLAGFELRTGIRTADTEAVVTLDSEDLYRYQPPAGVVLPVPDRRQRHASRCDAAADDEARVVLGALRAPVHRQWAGWHQRVGGVARLQEVGDCSEDHIHAESKIFAGTPVQLF